MTTITDQREFVAWPKIARLNRPMFVTEKIDGTNAAVVVTEDGEVYAQSRTRVITPGDDNHGFASWVFEHHDELRDQLGPGRHFGEWWGSGIQARYKGHIPQGEKRFSLFNVSRWTANDDDSWRCIEAPLCFVVPTLIEDCLFDTELIAESIEWLKKGSYACPGAEAEGIIVWHSAGRDYYKVTLLKDEEWKGKGSQ